MTKRVTASSVYSEFEQLDSLNKEFLAQLIDEVAQSRGFGYKNEKTHPDDVPEYVIKVAQEFEEAVKNILNAWVAANPEDMVDAEVTGDDLYDENGPYLVLMTIEGQGRTFMDGDWDHLVKDPKVLESLVPIMENKLRSFEDGTGMGSLPEAIEEAAYKLYGRSEEYYDG